jgi:hypothetical protein
LFPSHRQLRRFVINKDGRGQDAPQGSARIPAQPQLGFPTGAHHSSGDVTARDWCPPSHHESRGDSQLVRLCGEPYALGGAAVPQFRPFYRYPSKFEISVRMVTFRLEVTKGPASLEGRDFAIKDDQELLLGRAAKCDLQVIQF